MNSESSKQPDQSELSRRQFLKNSSLATASAAAVASFPFVLTSEGAESKLPIRVGLIGCGGRGTGAAGDVMKSADNVKIVALADIFQDRLGDCRKSLKEGGSEVSDDRCFTGFDAYQKLLALKDVNYVILATAPHFRHIHLRAAIEAGKHVFMEKPVAVDGPGVRSVIRSGELAKQKGLAIVCGTQRRHQNDYSETIKRLHDGAIGEILEGRAYWNQGGLWVKEKKPDWSEMEWQIRNWLYFTWLSGDHIVEQHIHNLDVINWVMNAHPVKAHGMGGRQARTGPEYGHIFDHFAVEYEYANGARMFSQCRQINDCENKVSEAVVGTNGTSDCHSKIEFTRVAAPAKAMRRDVPPGAELLIHPLKKVEPTKTENVWHFTEKGNNGYVQEHTDLIASIRSGRLLNEAQRIAESTLTAIMGREATYSGQAVSWDEMLNSKRVLAPEKYDLADAPPIGEVAIPGKYKFA